MGETFPTTLQIYTTRTGHKPFKAWLFGLRDGQTRARIRIRLERLQLGNPGDT